MTDQVINPNDPRQLSLQRAKHAYEYIEHLNPAVGPKFANLSKNAPAAIMANGLGQSMAFWKSKNEPHYSKLVDSLSTWVIKRLALSVPANQDLLYWVINTATDMQYRHATAEAIEYLIWVKRLAGIKFPS
jgi:CRISPR-associated protein Cmr5